MGAITAINASDTNSLGVIAFIKSVLAFWLSFRDAVAPRTLAPISSDVPGHFRTKTVEF
jgi:hypothetical protein